MYCYKCGCELGRTDHCPNCGVDVATYKKIIYTSNYLYNDGLEKARVRDLSGAILSLKNSLWYNKDNLDARNLLGLIYYELGETVAALAEWVISKNINDERLHRKQNAGADYLDQVQASKQTMDNLDSSIERYNHALECCYTDNLDVAVLQLKKVLQVNPHYLRARQLLALLYIENREYRRALRELQKCARLDVGNTTTLRYLQEVELQLGVEPGSTSVTAQGGARHTVRTVKTADTGTDKNPDSARKGTGSGRRRQEKLKPGTVIKYTDGNETIIQPVNARNPGVDGFGIPSWIYGGVIGLVVGAALVAFLVLPARVQMIRADSQDQIREISEESAAKDTSIAGLEDELESLESDLALLQEQIAAAEETQDTAFEDKANALMRTAAYYIADSVDLTDSAAAMAQILPSEAQEDVSDAFTQLYEQLYPLLRAQVLQDHADLGIAAYEAGDYESAVAELELAGEFEDAESYGQTYPQRLYYLADSYYQIYLADPAADGAAEGIVRAKELIAFLVETFPDSEYTASAGTLLLLLPDVTVEAQEQTDELTDGLTDAQAQEQADEWTQEQADEAAGELTETGEAAAGVTADETGGETGTEETDA